MVNGCCSSLAARNPSMRIAACILLTALLPLAAHPQPQPAQKAADKPALDSTLLSALKYRPIGPFRGGRSAACCGVVGKPMQFYFGATGGGVWKTTDGGAGWDNVSDGFFGG